MWLLLLACQENKVGTYNTAPAASIVSPPDGTAFAAGELVELYGLVGDAQTAAPDLSVLWTSSIDGDLDATAADIDGTLYFATATLSEGLHTITLSVVDQLAESASASISLDIGEGAPDPVGTGPTVTILGPTEGQAFAWADTVNLIAAVTDAEDAEETLQVELIDVPDGSVWTGTPTSTGSLTVPLSPTPGAHTLTLNARDADGNLSSATVSYSLEGDGRPTATIVEPSDGSVWSTLDTLVFRGTVADADTDVEALAVTWSSDLVGVFSTNPPDSAGATSVGTALPQGTHTVTLTAVDELGQTGLDSLVIVVRDPNDVDDDGDGWTENAGDCNDADASTYPAATDACDAVDNNCDGNVNEPYWDSFEPNNSAWGYDCGEVDASWLWSGDTLELSGLTLSDADDEDWFTWTADDEYYDNVSISVTASAFPSAGDYVLELWNLDSGRIEDSDAGTASLTVSYEGDLFDDDEDRWAVRLYATSWPAGTCSTSFTIAIHS